MIVHFGWNRINKLPMVDIPIVEWRRGEACMVVAMITSFIREELVVPCWFACLIGLLVTHDRGVL